MFSPVAKVSFGIVMLMVSVLFLGEMLGLVPDERRGFLESRKLLTESFAVQFSLAIGNRDLALVKATLENLVEREKSIRSAAVVNNNNRELLSVGRHQQFWAEVPFGQSTSTHVQVPIYEGNERWGSIQIVFEPLPISTVPHTMGVPLLPLALFMSLVGFVLTWAFVRKVITELDPQAVIPERVRSAFDALAEGLVILDERQRIILANTAFAEKVGVKREHLIGQTLSRINWDVKPSASPWALSLNNGEKITGATVKLTSDKNEIRTFAVNSTPIKQGSGPVKGALTTFDDLTDLERKQTELRETVSALQDSQKALQDKTVELEFLASRDPMTGCFNRRAFFEKAEALFTSARENGSELICIMTDIDHFKRVNDNHGHAVGDQVIKMVAARLKSNARPDDLVGRYGGEEFCIVLPAITLDETVNLANRLRVSISEAADKEFSGELPITSSFGAARLTGDVEDLSELINRADEALYLAKENGRNQVVAWHLDQQAANATASDETSQTSDANERQSSETENRRKDDSTQELQALRQKVTDLQERLGELTDASKNQTHLDSLTGLPNRALLLDRIQQATVLSQRLNQHAAIIVLDIDMFRRINEALGMTIGDQVIRTVAERLQEVLRGSDTVARIGDIGENSLISRSGVDEFAVLLSAVKNTDSVGWIARRMIKNLTKSLTVDGNEIHISCSAGISIFPDDTDSPEELLKHATSALHSAKENSDRNSFVFYAGQMNETSYRVMWLESELHKALERGELNLHFQPKFQLSNNTISGMEGLLRWQHPKLGNVSPGDFIPIAERTGLINSIGDWIVEQGCAQINRWRGAGFDDVSVALNLSAIQFRQGNLAHKIIQTVERCEVPPHLIELEVTESILMENFDKTLATLQQLSAHGFKISMDDFGTGYSSLAYLKHLPVDTLKIDRSFLNDTALDELDQKIVLAIIAMSHSLKLKVVAEGVETEAQRSYLSKVGCDEIQGFLMSKPVPADETMNLLAHYNHALSKTRKTA